MTQYPLIIWLVTVMICWGAFWKDWKKLTGFQRSSLVLMLTLCLMYISRAYF